SRLATRRRAGACEHAGHPLGLRLDPVPATGPRLVRPGNGPRCRPQTGLVRRPDGHVPALALLPDLRLQGGDDPGEDGYGDRRALRPDPGRAVPPAPVRGGAGRARADRPGDPAPHRRAAPARPPAGTAARHPRPPAAARPDLLPPGRPARTPAVRRRRRPPAPAGPAPDSERRGCGPRQYRLNAAKHRPGARPRATKVAVGRLPLLELGP